MNKKIIIIVVAVIVVGFVGFKLLSKSDHEQEIETMIKKDREQNRNLDIYPGLIKDKSKSETNK